MTLPSSGIITLRQVANELGQGGQFNMNRSDVRAVCNDTAGGQFSLAAAYGRTCAAFTVTIGTQSGGGVYGFESPNNAPGGVQVGGITPGTLRGIPIGSLVYSTFGSGAIQLNMDAPFGSFPSNLFTFLMLRNSTSAVNGTLPDVILAPSGFSGVGWTWTSKLGVLGNWPGLSGQNVQVQILY